MSVNSKMTAIADPIRSLLGLSGTMGMDAMAENLVEANTAVNGQTGLIQQIISALEGKVAGSGGGGMMITSGTMTPDSTIKSYITITHNLGEIPKLFILFATSSNAMATTNGCLFAIAIETQDTVKQYRAYYGGGAAQPNTYRDFNYAMTPNTSSGQPVYGATASSLSLNCATSAAGYMVSGYTYQWFACC